MIKIAIVDDEVLLRKSIRYILSDEKNIRILFDCNNGLELIQILENSDELPDILLLDVRMPIMDGEHVTKLITELYPDIRIIILSSIDSNHFIANMVSHGISSYLLKSASPEDVVKTINRVSEEGIYFNRPIMEMILQTKEKSMNPNELSQREIEVLKLICKQYNTKEIADSLFISERTVEGHRKKMLEKTQSKNVVGLILWSVRNNLFIS